MKRAPNQKPRLPINFVISDTDILAMERTIGGAETAAGRGWGAIEKWGGLRVRDAEGATQGRNLPQISSPSLSAPNENKKRKLIARQPKGGRVDRAHDHRVREG